VTGLPDGLSMRAVTDTEWPAFVTAAETAFGEAAQPDDIEHWRASIDLDRTRAVFDGDDIIATSLTMPFTLTVPGGQVATAGVTAVGVLPTHRRRGTLRVMMEALAEDARRRGEPVAALWASEAAIYRRFGYGLSAARVDLTVPTAHGAYRDEVDPRGRLRLLGPDEALATLPAIYERARHTTPGMLSRTPALWEGWLGRDPDHLRSGAGPRFVAVAGAGGYVAYRIRQVEQGSGLGNELVTEELVAVDDETLRLLWRYLLDVDLVATVVARNRPLDDPLELALAEPDRMTVTRHHALWLALLDAPAALSARSYATADRLVLDVAGQRLTVGADGCEPTGQAADLALTSQDLAAAYLGGSRLTRLARSGRVVEHTAGALRRADAMFAADREPWTAFVF
jgi:predicted acetyltransferase